MNRPSLRFASAASLFALAFLTCAWAFLISLNWHRIEQFCGHDESSQAARVFTWEDWDWKTCAGNYLGADAIEYMYHYRRFPESLADVDSKERFLQQIGVEYYKRPLYGPVSAALSLLLARVAMVEHPQRMFIVLGFYAALSTVLLFHLLILTGLHRMTAALLTATGTVSFGWMAVFSIPESYSLTVAGALVTMISGVLLQRLDARQIRVGVLRHCVITGIAAWLYLPICGAVLFLLGRARDARKLFTMMVPAAGLVCLIALLPQVLLGGSEMIGAQVVYGGQRSSSQHLMDPGTWTDVTAAFLMFTFVSPVNDIRHSRGHVDWHEVVSRPAALMLAAVVVVLCIGLFARSLRKRELYPPLSWLACLLVFHVYFNPSEVLLYLSLPLTLLMYAIGCAIRDIDAASERRVLVALAGLLFLLLGVNWPVVF